MRKSLLVFALLAKMLCSSAVVAQTSGAPRLVVRLTEELSAEIKQRSARSAKATAFEELNHQHDAVRVESLNPGQAPIPGVGQAPAAPAMYLITLPTGADVQQAQREYEQSGLFRYVELDAVGEGGGVQGTAPTDALYNRQWSLKNTGTFALAPARVGADISMENAWAITTGDSTVTVAIIDSGCKLDHPEFARRIWRNTRELPNNNIDDDQNGYVDDVRGWNFVSNTNDPTDDQGHGTNVTGIIGATGNNALGYAGVNWACKLMICKGVNEQNRGFYSWWTSGIYYAVNNGARVINMSLGGVSQSQAMQDAIAYANQRGVVVVACMMNTNNDTPYYPAALTGVVAVGSTNPDDTRSNPFFWSTTSGSNFGPHISVSAPGNYIYGLSHTSNTNYNSYWGGTSQATPHVAVLASLLLTLRPQLTPAQLRAILQATADDQVGNATEDIAGWDQYFGYGRINATRALMSVLTGVVKPQVAASALQVFPNPAREHLTITTTDARLLRHDLQVFNILGQLVYHQMLLTPTVELPLALPPGAYWLTVAGIGRKFLVE